MIGSWLSTLIRAVAMAVLLFEEDPSSSHGIAGFTDLRLDGRRAQIDREIGFQYCDYGEDLLHSTVIGNSP